MRTCHGKEGSQETDIYTEPYEICVIEEQVENHSNERHSIGEGARRQITLAQVEFILEDEGRLGSMEPDHWGPLTLG
jgi:hypothetical protein